MSEYKGEERRIQVDWHLSKSVSMSVILLLCINIGSTIWWASGTSSDIEVLKGKPNLEERVIRLEAKTDEHGRLLNKLEITLDKFDATLDKILLKGK